MKTPVQEANSLESLLVSIGTYVKEKKEKCLQSILLVLIVIAAVVMMRFYFYGKPQKFQLDFDRAYALSTQQAMMSGTPSPAPYDALASKYSKGNSGAEVRINAAEAVLKTAQSEVERKITASKAGKAPAEVIAMDPESTFNDAIKRFKGVTDVNMASDPTLAARALFGLASAWENLASVTAGDDEVSVKLDSAKETYQKVLDDYSGTPFAAAAKERLSALAEQFTLDFYKKTAADYVAMPVPEEEKAPESILSENPDNLDPNADVQNGENFNLQDDSANGEEAEPAEEKPAESESAESAEPAEGEQTETQN